MGARRISRAAAALAAAVLALGPAAPRAPAGEAAGEVAGRAPQPPVRIAADEAEYLNAENRVVFSGKVVAVQGDATLTADRMEVRFAPAASGSGGAPPAGGMISAGSAGARIETIVSTGNVTFRQVDPGTGNERFATGERGEYDAGARVVTLSGGSPRAWEGQNVMNCERMIFSLGERNMKCLGKVNMTVYPAEGKDPAQDAPAQEPKRP